MLGQPAGWYRDPAPANPTAPDTLRFWDGHAWTTQTRLATRADRRAWANEVVLERQRWAHELVARADAGDPEAQQILSAAMAGQGTRSTTPDGEPLAGWWRRGFACLLDGFLVAILSTALSWRYLRRMLEAYGDYFGQAVDAAEAGRPTPPVTELVSAISGPILAMTLIGVATTAAYEIGFLKAFQATPGKLALGLQVRLRSQAGPMPWRALVLRWAAKSGVSVLQLIPFGGLACSVYTLLDLLWPLWDGKRQALHDKAAGTNVVRRRR